MSASAMLGSSASLQGHPHSGTDIPKEYHRKLLKKIAQLTKVIYVLNTKNDENDELVLSIRTQHTAEVLKLSSDWSSRLERAQEECRSLREAGERRTQDVAREFEAVKCERDNLKASELQLLQLQGLTSNQMKELGNQLNQLKGEYANRVEEVLEQRRQHSASLKAAQSAHEQELAGLRAVLCKDKELAEMELERLRKSHTANMEALKQQYEARVQMSGSAMVTAEGKKWQERLEAVQHDAAEKESALSQRMSQLATELRITKDKLTLSEQKVRGLEAAMEGHSGSLTGLQTTLLDAQEHAKSLQTAVASLQVELCIAKDKYQQQCAEMLKMSGTMGKLEALRVSNMGEIENLKSSIAVLKDRLSWLEKERETLASSQKASEQSQLKIKNLEKEVGRLIREKQELHTQYAHEIEAAHSQLNEREHQLEVEHMKVLQELRAQGQEALAAAMKEKASELTGLRKEVETRAEAEMAAIVERHQKEAHSLQAALAGRGVELASALSSLERLKREVEEKKEGLGSVSSQVEKLTRELEEAHQAAEAVQKMLSTERLQSEQLKLTLKELRDDHVNTINECKKRVEKVQMDLARRLEEQWAQKLRDECASLRSELAQRHREDLDCALAELSALKDQAMMDATALWNDERNKLVERVACLEEKLDNVQFKGQLSLESARTAHNEELAALRGQMDSNAAAHQTEMQRLVESHGREVVAIKEQHQVQTEELRKELLDAHSGELELVQKSNLICIKSLQEEWLKNQAEEISHLQVKHSAELDNLCSQLQSKFQVELAGEKERHQSDLHLEQKAFEEKWRNAQKEIAFCQMTIRNLEAEAERKGSELAALKGKEVSLSGAVNELRKELEVKGQEILSVRREANTQVQLQQQQLSAAHRAELDSINRNHQHRVQGLLNDFNKAKELLIQKIGELERKYLDAEERYQTRESRPEDLEEIQKLKASVTELQSRIKEMAAELRIYQLELANREKNYNKLFGVNPVVGVLDPVTFTKKKTGENFSHSSAPSLMEPTSDCSSPPPRRLRHLEPIESKIKAHRVVTLKGSPPPQSTKVLTASMTTQAEPLPVQL